MATTKPPQSPTLPPANSSRKPTLLDYLKPRPAEAKARLRRNGVALGVLFVATHAVGFLPTPWTCVWFLFVGGSGMTSLMRGLCWIGEAFCLRFVFFGVVTWKFRGILLRFTSHG